MLSLYKDAWAGKASLAKSFWLVFIVTHAVIHIVINIILNLLAHPVNLLGPVIPAQQNILTVRRIDLIIDLIATLIPVLYTFFSFICIWKCGKNSTKFWLVISRIWIILTITISVYWGYSLHT